MAVNLVIVVYVEAAEGVAQAPGLLGLRTCLKCKPVSKLELGGKSSVAVESVQEKPAGHGGAL